MCARARLGNSAHVRMNAYIEMGTIEVRGKIRRRFMLGSGCEGNLILVDGRTRCRGALLYRLPYHSVGPTCHQYIVIFGLCVAQLRRHFVRTLFLQIRGLDGIAGVDDVATN